MKKLDFTVPFSGFGVLNFINCFTSTYMYLEGAAYRQKNRIPCGKSTCEECGYCRGEGRYFFLFDTMCGRSALRCRFDGARTEMEKMICETDFYDGGTDYTIEFLFGFAGYEYRKVIGDFKAETIASIDAGKPVIAKVKSGAGRFRVIIGYDKDKLLEPEYKGAQKLPKKGVKYDEIEALYIVGEKIQPRYTLKDGLEECADWKKHAAGYFGEMVELTLCQIKKNDEEALDCIKQALAMLEE